MYTLLNGKVKLQNNSNSKPILTLIREYQYYINVDTFDNYEADYKLMIDNILKEEDSKALLDFIEDYRWDMVFQECKFDINKDYITIIVHNSNIKNYTYTYDKFYSLLNETDLIEGELYQLYEEFITPKTFRVINGKLMLV